MSRNSRLFQKVTSLPLTIALLISFCFSFIAYSAQQGQAVDVVPFGEITRWDADGKDSSFGVPAFAGASAEKALRRMDYGVFWEDSRDIFRVLVSFADPNNLSKPEDIGLEYWQSTWPNSRIPRNRPSGAGDSGWLNIGDWFQGKWRKADTKLQVDGSTYAFTFNLLNAKEFPDMKDFPPEYRSTMKLRVIGGAPLPKIQAIECYTDSTWEPLEFEVEWGATAKQQQTWDGGLEVFNGTIEKIQPISAGSEVKVSQENKWTSSVKNKMDGIRARILFAKTNAYNSFDETVVTVRTACESFSFAASDLIKDGHIFIPDFGVIIRKAGDDTTYASAEKLWKENSDKNIYRRVSSVPEQTFPNAWKDIPQKEPFYIPLGFDGGRQYFGLEPDGSIFCRFGWLHRIPGRDTKRCLFDGDSVTYNFGLSDAKLVDRQLVDGCLPMIVTEWQRDNVNYRQTAFIVPFDGVPKAGQAIYADDTLVLLARFEITRTADNESEAKLDIGAGSDLLTIDDGFIFVTGTDPKRLRMLITSSDRADSYTLQAKDKKVAYQAKLTAAKPKRTLDVAIPFITLTEKQEWAKLRTIKFDKAFKDVHTYWQERVKEGTQIVTPEPMINDFYKAHVSHLLLNTDREVGTSDRYVARVGTFSYGAFSNESCMMVSDLDRRGYHKRAEQALETWLHYQGTEALPGNYSNYEGVFYGAGNYEDGGYNQHHGFVLWCLGEHYFYTRDVNWLKNAAPKIVKGCEWIINQRKRTIDEARRSPIRAIERGLLPPGSLEDIRDWRCWMSNNVYSWFGMHNAAAALTDAGLPDGRRLLDEAEAYRKDILAAFTGAMQRTPVVRLRDGSWVPHIPPDVHRRGRTFGWITETLEGPIHLIRTGLLEPQDRMSTWIIKDFEDNLYISEQYGYNITGADFDRYWFSRGGISMQANLLCNPIPYLLRDEPGHFLRAYFNAFATSYWPDTRMMTEHALPNIGDHRGDHYKSSDEANSTFWLRLMFIQERGDALYLGAAIPRYWLADGNKIGVENASTYFGPMSVKYESNLKKGKIEVALDPPRRNPPKKIFVRFRHPEGKKMTRCEVNGKVYKNFDPHKEWVVLTDCPKKTTRIVAYYN
jgi:hypothetical protein